MIFLMRLFSFLFFFNNVSNAQTHVSNTEFLLVPTVGNSEHPLLVD